MDEYKVEFFIVSDDEQEIKLTNLNEKEIEHWKRELEEQALFEYFKRKIKMSGIEISFKIGYFTFDINSGKLFVFINIGFKIGCYLCYGKNIETGHKQSSFPELFF